MDKSSKDSPIDHRAPNSNPDPTVRRHPVIRIAMFASGCALLLAGFLLGFVPFLPGFPLGLLGIGLLAASSSRVRTLLRAAAHKLPARWRRRARAAFRSKKN